MDWSERLNDLENPKGAYTRLIDNSQKSCYMNNI